MQRRWRCTWRHAMQRRYSAGGVGVYRRAVQVALQITRAILCTLARGIYMSDQAHEEHKSRDPQHRCTCCSCLDHSRQQTQGGAQLPGRSQGCRRRRACGAARRPTPGAAARSAACSGNAWTACAASAAACCPCPCAMAAPPRRRCRSGCCLQMMLSRPRCWPPYLHHLQDTLSPYQVITQDRLALFFTCFQEDA